MAGRPRKQRITALRDRRLYLRFTEGDYALIQRLGVLRGMCPADTVTALAWEQAMLITRYCPDLYRWWLEEICRIQKEEQQT